MTYLLATFWQVLTWGAASIVAGVLVNTWTGSEGYAWAAAIVAAVFSVMSAFVVETEFLEPFDWDGD
jgi:FtsH-binding integral membrane protein